MASIAAASPKLFYCQRRKEMARRRNPPPWNCPALFLLRCGRPAARCLLVRISGDGGAAEANPRDPALPPDIEMLNTSVNAKDGYVGLFVRMLGLDNDPLDREQAIITLWKYSEGGKNCIEAIMQFPGCINLVVSLLKSESCSTCEAAAGLLRTISSVNLYRDIVAESGAVEEIFRLLCQSFLALEVKEQSLCILWNLSIDEKLRVRIANNDFLPMVVKFLDDEEIKVKEAAGGILANLALSPCNHSIMVEAGVIPKLADLFKSNNEGYKIIRKEAKTTLLELSKDEYYRILVIEEGLIRVPVVGAAAYKSFRPQTYSWPSLPDGTEIQQNSRPSKFGASELLLGLNIREKNFNLEETKVNAMVGRSQQQFLARIGAIEMENGRNSQSESSLNQQYTLLPWMDGVARLVLIIGLEDVSAITRAAYSIADASINERMRISFKEAGAVRHLVKLLCHDNEATREAAAHALDRLSVSYVVCQIIEMEGGPDLLINILKDSNTSNSLLELTVNILCRIFDPVHDVKTKFQDKFVDESEKVLIGTSSSQDFDGLSISKTSSVSEGTTRERIIDSDVILRLVDILRTSSPNLQIKVASILEFVAAFEPHVATITAAGINSALDVVFQKGSLDGMDGDDDNALAWNVIEAEEIGLAIAAASKLLAKLLNFEQFCHSIDAMHYVHLLRKILKSNIPLHAKDWVAACLIKLESKFGLASNLGHAIDMEVTLYETIPRLVEQMRTSFADESREAAVIELNKIISRGVMECTRAVAAAGGIFPLVELIKDGSGDALEASLAILHNLSMDSENHAAIIAAGAVPILKRIVLSEGPQWKRALRLLRTVPT
ncbi:U-box domain-containing protein 12 [Cocos nucifera]|nr:U-box domain-containing protein 12 [Cocos nucifera]